MNLQTDGGKLKILTDKDLTKADKKRIAARKKARRGAPYFLSMGSRRMAEITAQKSSMGKEKKQN